MKIVIESEDKRREINRGFKIYGKAEDLKIIANAIQRALNGNLAQGWVEVGETLEVDETVFPFDVTADEKPTFPWGNKP